MLGPRDYALTLGTRGSANALGTRGSALALDGETVPTRITQYSILYARSIRWGEAVPARRLVKAPHYPWAREAPHSH